MNINSESVDELYLACIKQVQDRLIGVNNPQSKHVFHESAHFEILHPESFKNPISYDGSIFSHAENDDIFNIEASHYNEIVKQIEISNIIECLKKDPDSKKAYLSLWNNNYNFGASGEVPCLVGVHFYIDNGELFTVVHMRSNELLKLLPVDICFGIALQKYVGSKLEINIGTYVHQVGSLILYSKDLLEFKSL